MFRTWTVAAALAALAAIGTTLVTATLVVPSESALATPAVATAVSTARDDLDSQQDLPPALRVPPGNHVAVTLQVLQGTQVYTCTNNTWSFTEPAADMGIDSRPIVLYTAGPEWVSTVDGSAVWGQPIASVDRTGTIPELLVKAVKNRGDGLFGKIDYIQRLNTVGGLPPQGNCTNNTIITSQYLATEKFWASGQGN